MNKFILAATFTLVTVICFSQPGPPAGPPPCWPPPCIPIDGGISIFTIIAAYFGYKCYNKTTH